MARQLLIGPQAVSSSQLRSSADTALRQPQTKERLNALLRKSRSKQYLDTIAKLDAGGCSHDKAVFNAFLEALLEELPEITIDALPVGIISKCYLGDPYEVHTVDRLGSVIHHYKFSEPLPALMAGARSLAANPRYLFIEVYRDKFIAVSESGSVSIIER